MYKSCRCILICSNHRSGSSALSGCLNLCGIDYGKNKNRDYDRVNPKGYFENDAFLQGHDDLLSVIGQNWDSPEKTTKDQDKILKLHFHKLVNLFNEQFDSEIFFIKDPRILLVYPAYVKALKELNITPYLIWIERNDKEIIKSLAKAQGTPEETARGLCKKHRIRFKEFVSNLENPKTSKVSFNGVIQDPIKAIRQIENDFSLDLVSGNEEKIKDFIDPKLKHF